MSIKETEKIPKVYDYDFYDGINLEESYGYY